jgi:hypothetical protein
MKVLSLNLIAILFSLTGFCAQADETPVFVSCYSDAGEHLQLIFDTAETKFSYRYEKDTTVVEFESEPRGSLGKANSSVTKIMPQDQKHIELRAQIIGGDAETPLIDTSAEDIFDRDETGSLRLTAYSLYHLSQPYNLDSFKIGSCYVQ